MGELFCSAHNRQIAHVAEHVTDARVLDALRATPRALFAPEDQRSHAYEDRALTLDGDVVVPAPLVVARMCEALDLSGHERVLDVGTGLGYRAAVIAALAARVVTVGSRAPLVAEARQALRRAGIANAEAIVGDPVVVASQYGPFDAIALPAAGFKSSLPALEDHVVEGGRLVAPLGIGRRLMVAERRGAQRPVRILPLARGVQLV